MPGVPKETKHISLGLVSEPSGNSTSWLLQKAKVGAALSLVEVDE